MKAKFLVYALPVLILATIHLAGAQQPEKLHRIAFLLGGPSSSYSARIDVFKQGLKELGYVDGKNIAIEYRSADGRLTVFSILPLSWCVSKWISFLLPLHPAFWPSKRRPQRSPLSSWGLVILLPVASSLALRDPVGMSQGWQTLPRS